MAASNTRFTQNSLGQSKNPIDSDHGIYRDYIALAHGRLWHLTDLPILHNHVRLARQTRNHLNLLSISADDPTPDSRLLGFAERNLRNIQPESPWINPP